MTLPASAEKPPIRCAQLVETTVKSADQLSFVRVAGRENLLSRAYLTTSTPLQIAEEAVSHAAGNLIGLPMPSGYIVTSERRDGVWWGVNAFMRHSCLKHCQNGRHDWARQQLTEWTLLPLGALFDLLIGKAGRAKESMLFTGGDVFLVNNRGLSDDDAIDSSLLRVLFTAHGLNSADAVRRIAVSAASRIQAASFHDAMCADETITTQGRVQWARIKSRAARLPRIVEASLELLNDDRALRLYGPDAQNDAGFNSSLSPLP